MTADTLKNLDEALLVNYCKENNAAAQKILYHRYVDGMMVMCLRYIPDAEDAKEVLMDGFFNFFRSIDGFIYAGEGSVRAWLTKIMINQCLMQLRKRRNVFVIGKDDMVYEHKDDGESPLEYLTVKDILAMIHALPDGYRTVFNLYVFEGLTHKEIGALLNISDSTSKSQLHRARAMLKEKVLQAT